MEKRQNSKNAKKKRPEISLYIPPAFRSKPNKKCEDKMKCAKGEYANETANTQAYSLERHNLQERCSEIVSRRVRFGSSGSSSEPKHTSNESYKDDDSSDFEDCDFVSMEDLNIGKKTNESNSDDHWETGGRRLVRNPHAVETENDQILDKIPNRILRQYEGSSVVNSYANEQLCSESNETKLDGGLFDSYDDSISDIEAIIDIKRSVLTSTPNSDITEQKVLNAANYVPEEGSELESTLLGQTDIHESNNRTNRNKRDNNFDIYRDPPSIESQPIDYTEIFGNNYIPPPVPPPASTFRLPSIQYLPPPTSQPYKFFVPRHVSFQNMPPFPVQLRRPRQIFVPQCPNIPRLSPAYSSYFPSTRHHILSPCLRPVTIPPANATRVSSIPPTVFSQERTNSPRFLEHVFYPPYLRQQNGNLQNLETYKQEDPFYIPPPISHPQMMNGSQPISNLNLRQNVQNFLPSSYLLTNRMVFDDKFRI